MNILVLAAHPDDEDLGMGGTIKKYTKKGHNLKPLKPEGNDSTTVCFVNFLSLLKLT